MTAAQFIANSACPSLWTAKPIADISISEAHELVNDLVTRADELKQYRGYERAILHFAMTLAARFPMALIDDDLFKLAAITKNGSRVLKEVSQ